jgi:hypothetical protein
MTAKRDLKRRVRDRQARTGESYMTALRHVRDQRTPSPVVEPAASAMDVSEMFDITEIAATLGMKCRVRLAPGLAPRIDAASVLRQLRTALTTTERDRQFDTMRAVVLHGEQRLGQPLDAHASWRFAERLRTGVGGISDTGRLLAMTVNGRQGLEMLVFALWLPPAEFAHLARMAPSLVISAVDQMTLTAEGFGQLLVMWR